MNFDDVGLSMKQNKIYLKNIFDAQNVKETKKLIKSSSEEEANILLQILFCLTHGNIPLKKSQFLLIQKSRKHLLLNKFFQTKAKLEENLSFALKTKIQILLKFALIYKQLLYTIFIK